MSYDNQKGNWNKHVEKGQGFRKNDANTKNLNKPADHKNFNKKDSSYLKDKEDYAKPVLHPKKSKPKNEFYDVEIPEYLVMKEQGRRKRENDKKYKSKKYR